MYFLLLFQAFPAQVGIAPEVLNGNLLPKMTPKYELPASIFTGWRAPHAVARAPIQSMLSREGGCVARQWVETPSLRLIAVLIQRMIPLLQTIEGPYSY